MSGELYETVHVSFDPKKFDGWENADVGTISDKYGTDLIDHMMFYGASKGELEKLDRRQIAMLEGAGLLRPANR